VHTVLSLVQERSISDNGPVASSLQRLGDLFLMIEKHFASANACYHASIEIFQHSGVRRHVADCVVRFGIILFLQGKVEEAEKKTH